MKEFACGGDWKFFKKGNANSIYKYVGESKEFSQKLLRLRLSNQKYDTKQVFEYIESKIRPILSETIKTELVIVKFHKEECMNDGFGLLIPNLFPFDSQIIKKDRYFQVYQSKNSVTLELKPKWLIMNPRGCRNCANHRHKYNEVANFCTLRLLDPNQLHYEIMEIFDDELLQSEYEKYFQSNDNILNKLRSLQNDITFEVNSVADELKLQMSLRDVTVFIKFEDGIFKSFVTDIDPKSLDKWQSWKIKEERLITEECYRDH